MEPALLVPAIAVGWLLTVAWAPAQTAAASRTFSVADDWPGTTCRHFATGRVVDAEFGATVGLHAQVCWNGRQAFLVGDPQVPPPDAARVNPFGDRDLTACCADNAEDFALVTGTTCTATTEGDGTLHYSVHARVAPLPFAIGAQEVTMNLVVARDGRVLEQP